MRLALAMASVMPLLVANLLGVESCKVCFGFDKTDS